MIVPVDKSLYAQYREACRFERVFGSKCWTALQAYGENDPRASFWLGVQESRPSAALYLADGVLTVSSDNRIDPVELGAFIRQNAIHEVDTNDRQAALLQEILGGAIENSYYMVYTGDRHTGDLSAIQPYQSLEDVFSVLQQSHAYYREHLQYAKWAEDMQRKLDRGLSQLYQVNDQGIPVGTGCIVSSDEECGVIAAVAVIPTYRHRGLGSQISKALVNEILDQGKTPRLISGYDAVAELYRQIGFTPVGRWGELYLPVQDITGSSPDAK